MANLAAGRAVASGRLVKGQDALVGIEDLAAYTTADVTLIGDGRANFLVGGAKFEGGERTVFRGGGGNDKLLGAADGHATFLGGKGHDRLFPTCTDNDSSTVVRGGPGNDRLTGCGRSTQFGGTGNDVLGTTLPGTLLGEGGARFFGQDGDDILRAAGNRSLNGGAGVDWIDYRFTKGGLVHVEADLASNRATAFYATSSAVDVLMDIEGVLGSRGPDDFLGSTAGDFLNGYVGDDVADGRGGADSLVGGEGDDTLHGGDEDDILQAGDGADFLDGEAGNNSNDGGDGTDNCINPDTVGGALKCELP